MSFVGGLEFDLRNMTTRSEKPSRGAKTEKYLDDLDVVSAHALLLFVKRVVNLF